MYKDKNILILGAARSGIAACKLLSSDNKIVLSDIKDISIEDKKLLDKLNVEVVITDKPEELINEETSLLIKSPGISQKNSAVQKAASLNIKVVNEVEVAYSFIPKTNKIIGITGSNGKTTTTTLTYEMLKLMGKKVVLGGNIGIPLCDIVKTLEEDSILVLEISDHQLLNMENFKTDISLLTNICPTHLDFHDSYQKYKETKMKIFNNHTNNDLAFINMDNLDSMEMTNNLDLNKVYFNNSNTGNYIDDIGIYVNNELIINLDDILLVGIHNYENILASLMIINEFGIDKEVVKNYLSAFKGVEHRIEFVRNINNIKYYNDSKATNPTSTITALRTFNKPIHLLLGGMERSQDFNELNNDLNNIKCIYALGEVTDRIYEYGKINNINVIKCYDLNSAVKEVQQNVLENEIVLLSPGSASWDQYAKFEDRGEEFKNLINKI